MATTLTKHITKAVAPGLFRHVVAPGAVDVTGMKKPTGSYSHDRNAMYGDISHPQTPRNPHVVEENCDFVSMAYLFSTPNHQVTLNDLVKMTETMQPTDGKGGLETPGGVERLLKDAAFATELQCK